ncbi:MAG: [protein-PII] uridylyltransferase, partial [Janthinobacterium lividum]
GYTRHGRQDGVERFMRHYFLTAREVGRLTLVLEPAILRKALGAPALAAVADPALRAQGFGMADGMLVLAPGHTFRADPLALLRVLEVAREYHVELHPLTLRALIRDERCAVSLRGDPAASAIFLDLLCGRDAAHNRADGARWMRILNETGLLGRYMPDWARIVGQMQFDTYHVFTVDEHTIEAIAVVNRLERNELSDVLPVATSIVENLQSRRALYVATLLHDIAKGRGGDHSELGAELALEIGPQIGLSAEETETISWLVLHHLLLSQTAFRRDIDDPKTILDLADTIQSPERLKLLLVLTVADMRAVSPRVWNGWKATLLRELYSRVAEVLAGGLATTERDVRVARSKEACDENLAAAGWGKADRDAFLALGYGGYWLSFDPETHVRHAQMVRDAEARGAPLLVETQPLPARAVTEVTVYVTDHAGLVSRIAGALAVAGASIVDARVHTLTNGRALDTFWIQDAAGGAFDAPHRLARLSVLIEQALAGELSMDAAILKAGRALMGSRMRAIHVPPRVVVDNRASNTHTVVEINGRDRPGLMHDVTAAISEQGVQIASAHVTTYGVRAVDVFYVKDVFGLKIENERKLALLREALLRALTTPGTAGPLPAPPARRRRDAA